MYAIGTDDIACTEPALIAAFGILNGHSDAVVVLFDADQLHAVQNPGTGFRGAVTQDRFEAGLRDEQTPRRAEAVDALVNAWNEGCDLPSRK